MRRLIIISGLMAGLLGASAYAESLTVGPIDPETSQNLVLKKIVERVGNQLVALVVDGEGRERHILITGDDAIEIKRALWVIRPGTYQTDI